MGGEKKGPLPAAGFHQGKVPKPGGVKLKGLGDMHPERGGEPVEKEGVLIIGIKLAS